MSSIHFYFFTHCINPTHIVHPLEIWLPRFAPPPCAPEKVCFASPRILRPQSAHTLSTCIVAVTEGYLSSPPSSPLKQAPAISLTTAAGFPLAARENNRQIFSASSGTYSPLPSPSKRKRSHPDSHDDDEQSITPFFVTPQFQDRKNLAMELCGDDMVVDSLDRPMKPLRRSGRIREVSPLPLTRSLFPCETEMNSHQCEEESTNMHSTQLL